MSFFFLFFLLPLTILFLLSFLRRRPPLPLPPGPKPLPIIGNMRMMGQLTHRGLARLADRYGGLFHLRLGFLHAVAVSTPEIAKQVLQVQDNIFSNRPATIAISYLTYDRADMAFAHYGPFWRQMRKLCVTKLFSRKRAESWTSVREEVDSTIKTLANKTGSPVNVGELVFNLTMNITLRAAFGTQSSDNEEKFISILQEFSKLFGAFNIGDFIPWLKWFDLNGINERLRKARLELDEFIDKIIEEHRRNPKEADAEDTDMVDDMLAFFVDQTEETGGNAHTKDFQGNLKLTKDNIKAIIMDVMFGGTETVASAIEWAMAEILRSPDELKRIQTELNQVVGLTRKVHESDLEKLPYLKCAIKETLRLHPPIPLLLHETAEDSAVAGYFIPARTRVMINVWAIGRNKAAWKDPNAFRPARFAPGGLDSAVDFRGNFFELLPFGSGRRSCPGMQLGLYALELAVANLLHCFAWELPDGMKPSELSMDDVFGLTAPRAERLVAVPKPRLLCALDA
ncbi:cytochrome P450 84A1 [Dendrobium catenatum]|uniref:Cytochrome P450 84A1 n=1 Tax=Dendrobium catenatum TaxID=906689 RepID=A0A2I0VXT4_9ASPA|nr:cytochrome P450 84A1 [Dendrobium catenatum]PKU68221.1 Cytochrome P450 84A1 [Dendrobium catenatum]